MSVSYRLLHELIGANLTMPSDERFDVSDVSHIEEIAGHVSPQGEQPEEEDLENLDDF